MKTVAALLALALATGAAQATTIPVAFSGIVDDGSNLGVPPTNTGFAAGAPISGSFVFDTSTNTFTSFQIGGYAISGATAIYSPPLAATGFAYLGERTTDASGQPTAELQIDFYYEGALPATTDIGAFIANPGAFSTDLAGGAPSYFAVNIPGPNGPVQLDALLTAYAAPEPGALMLAAPALFGLAFARRRRV